MSISRLGLIALTALCLVIRPALAQEDAAPERRLPEPEPVAPYEAELLRLSEVLGAVHYLRALCVPKETPIWRDRMNELILTEKPSPDLESKLVRRFNKGYEAYSLSYQSCTDAAQFALDRYVREGATLSRTIADRYGS